MCGFLHPIFLKRRGVYTIDTVLFFALFTEQDGLEIIPYRFVAIFSFVFIVALFSAV